jgi:hypothetical protein
MVYSAYTKLVFLILRSGITNMDLKNITVKDLFWSVKQKLVREVVIPYQWELLNDEAGIC